MAPPTVRQMEAIFFIGDYFAEHGEGPTSREVADYLQITDGYSKLMRRMAKRGLIDWSAGRRATPLDALYKMAKAVEKANGGRPAPPRKPLETIAHKRAAAPKVPRLQAPQAAAQHAHAPVPTPPSGGLIGALLGGGGPEAGAISDAFAELETWSRLTRRFAPIFIAMGDVMRAPQQAVQATQVRTQQVPPQAHAHALPAHVEARAPVIAVVETPAARSAPPEAFKDPPPPPYDPLTDKTLCIVRTKEKKPLIAFRELIPARRWMQRTPTAWDVVRDGKVLSNKGKSLTDDEDDENEKEHDDDDDSDE